MPSEEEDTRAERPEQRQDAKRGSCFLSSTPYDGPTMSEDLFISVDCETSGPFPGKHALLSIGAVVVRRDRDSWLTGDEFYTELAPQEGAEQVPQAMAVHGLDWTRLCAEAQSLPGGALSFASWVSSQTAVRRLFVGYNAAFDWAFVLHALGVAGLGNPFHYVPIDLKSAIWGAHGGSWKGGSNVEALERVVGRSLAPPSNLKAHNALDDARAQALVLVALLEHIKALSSGARKFVSPW